MNKSPPGAAGVVLWECSSLSATTLLWHDALCECIPPAQLTTAADSCPLCSTLSNKSAARPLQTKHMVKHVRMKEFALVQCVG